MSNDINITAHSSPDYDSWGWDSYWSAENWISFHKALVKEHGRTKGDAEFLEHWHAGPTFIVARANYLSFEPDFIEYFENQGIYDSMNNGIGKIVSDSTRVVAEAPKVVTDTVRNTFSVVKYLVPALVVVMVVIGILWIRAKIKMANALV